MNWKYSERQAIMIGRQAKAEAARWESAVEEYIFKCGGRTDDARAVVKSIRKAVER